jgi:hypothetical protein
MTLSGLHFRKARNARSLGRGPRPALLLLFAVTLLGVLGAAPVGARGPSPEPPSPNPLSPNLLSPNLLSPNLLSPIPAISAPTHSAPLRAGTVEFVRGGKPVGVYEPNAPWTRLDKSVEGRGGTAWLYADHDLGTGDFEIRAVLEIVDLDRGDARLQIGGGQVIFHGPGGMVVTKDLEDGEKSTDRGSSIQLIPEGKLFELRYQRKTGRFKLWIDRREIASGKARRGHVGGFGFNPGSSIIRVREFIASGDVLDIGRQVRIDPSEFEALASEERLDRAVEAGVAYLLARIEGKQEAYRGRGHENSAPGAVALETYALIVAGVSVDHPIIRENLKYVNREIARAGRTYDLACGLFALDAALVQLEQDLRLIDPDFRPKDLATAGRAYLRNMDSMLEVLLTGQNRTGAWRYDTSSNDFDNSCTQFAALGLAVAARRGLRIPAATWSGLADHLLASQQKEGKETSRRAVLEEDAPRDFEWSRRGRDRRRGSDDGEERDSPRRGGTGVAPEAEPDPFLGDGSAPARARGWAYANFATDKATWNMTCSGVSSLMILYSHGGHALTPERRAEVTTAIRDGLGWMMENWTDPPHGSAYAVYSLEKVADIGGIARFDEYDWYPDARDWILGAQHPDGSWDTGGTGEIPRVSTALLLLVLKRATTLLTRDPSEQVIASGGGQQRSEEESRAWVYLPRLDRSIQLQGLLRTLRMRPSVPLMKLLEEVVEAYPFDHLPELLPGLLALEGRLDGKGPRATLDRCLAQICGRPLEDEGAYRAWYDSWQEIRLLESDEESLVRETRLVEIYREQGGDARMKRVLIPIFIRLGLQSAVDELLPDLDHDDEFVRALSYRGISALLSGTPPRFDPSATGGDRANQIDAIRQWVLEKRVTSP